MASYSILFHYAAKGVLGTVSSSKIKVVKLYPNDVDMIGRV